MSINLKRGDTLVEVSIAIVIFCIISVLSIGLMNRDLSAIQGTLELEMARNEIDAQAEALRFIQNSYLAELESSSESKSYQDIWNNITSRALLPSDLSSFEATQCSAYYNRSTEADGDVHNIFEDKAFIVNTRSVTADAVTLAESSEGIFQETSLYPRVVFTVPSSPSDTSDQMIEDQDQPFNQIGSVEGIWVIAVKDSTSTNPNATPEFYDFHIRTCWYGPGRDTPSTIATIVRLYNPSFNKEES